MKDKLAAVGVAFGLIWASPGYAEWQLVYKNSDTGEPLQGSKERLVDAVRLGLPIRLAWGAVHPRTDKRFVEHVAVPEFLTVVDGEEVFVQIPEHIAQTSYWDREFQDFNTPAVMWRGLFSTTGRFLAVWYNRATGQTIDRKPQRVPMSWFVDMPASTPKSPAKLWEEK